MPEHSTDASLTRADLRAAAGAGAGDSGPRPSRQRTPRTDWRLGGRTVFRWREWMLALSLLSLGIALVLGAGIAWLWASPWAGPVATAVIWLGMLVPVVYAFSLSRPISLLRMRPIDLLYGIALAGILRIVQGWVEVATDGSGAFPSYPLIDGRLSSTWWLTDGLGPVVIAPVIEELFFRAVILISVYTVLRRALGGVWAGAIAVIVSTALFVVAHGLTGATRADDLISLSLLGLVCALIVLLTGRLAGALLVHVFYNLSFVLLALVGTYLG